MTTSTDGFFSSLTQALYTLGRFMWALPKTLSSGFAWFASKKIEFPNTDEGRRLKSALAPQSTFDTLAQAWAHASFWTKGAGLMGSSLLFGLFGLAFGASFLFSLTALTLGLGLHALLVSHHEQRVSKIQCLIKEQNVVKEEVDEVLESIHVEVVDLLQSQKKEVKASVVQVKQHVKSLTDATTSLERQVDLSETVHKQLEGVGAQITTTLDEVGEQTRQWNKALEHNQEASLNFIESTQQFSTLVDEITSTHKTLDETVGELHEAVVKLSRPTVDEDSADVEADDLLINLIPYADQAHYSEEQIKAFDARELARADTRIKEADVLLDEHTIKAHRDAIHTTDAALVQLEQRREERASQRKVHEATIEKLLSAPTIMPPQQESSNDVRPSLEEQSAQLAWLDAVNQSIVARQKRLDGYKDESLKVKEDERNNDHQVFVSSIDANLKARSEQRKARIQQLQATSRFFGVPSHATEGDQHLTTSALIH